MMDDYWQIWHGQLYVGSEDLGQATIWSAYNSDIPAIGGSLKMTRIADYNDLWLEILRCQPSKLSLKNSTVINGKLVSVFKISSDNPQFLELTEEMTNEKNNEAVILIGQFLNPGLRVQVVLASCSAELMKLGISNSHVNSRPSLVILFICTESVDCAIGVPRKRNESTMNDSDMMDVFHEPGSHPNWSHKSDSSEHFESHSREKKCVISNKDRKNKYHSQDTLKCLEDKKPDIVVQRAQCEGDQNFVLKPNDGSILESKFEEKDESSLNQCKGDIMERENVNSHTDMIKRERKSGKNLRKTIFKWHISRFFKKTTKLKKKKENAHDSKKEYTTNNYSFEDINTFKSNKQLYKTGSSKIESIPSYPIVSKVSKGVKLQNRKSSFLDSGKLCDIFSLKDTSKPDLIKPSMLKKNLHTSTRKGEDKLFSKRESCRKEASTDLQLTGIANTKLKQNESLKMEISEEISVGNSEEETNVEKRAIQVASSQDQAYEKMELHKKSRRKLRQKLKNEKDSHIQITSDSSTRKGSSTPQKLKDSVASSGRVMNLIKDLELNIREHDGRKLKELVAKKDGRKLKELVAKKDVKPEFKTNCTGIKLKKVQIVLNNLMEDLSKLKIFSIHDALRTSVSYSKLKKVMCKKLPKNYHLPIKSNAKNETVHCDEFLVFKESSKPDIQKPKYLNRENIKVVHSNDNQILGPLKANTPVKAKKKRRCETNDSLDSELLSVAHSNDVLVPVKANTPFKAKKKRLRKTCDSSDSGSLSVAQPSTSKADERLHALNSDNEAVSSSKRRLSAVSNDTTKQLLRNLPMKRKRQKDKLEISCKKARLDQETFHITNCYKNLKSLDNEIRCELPKGNLHSIHNSSKEAELDGNGSDTDSLMECSSYIKFPVISVCKNICSIQERTSDLELEVPKKGGNDLGECDRCDRSDMIPCEEISRSKICHSVPPLSVSDGQVTSSNERGRMDFELIEKCNSLSYDKANELHKTENSSTTIGEYCTEKGTGIENLPLQIDEIKLPDSLIQPKSVLYGRIQNLHALDQESNFKHSFHHLSKFITVYKYQDKRESKFRVPSNLAQESTVDKVYINPSLLAKIQSWYSGKIPLDSIMFTPDIKYQPHWSSITPVSTYKNQHLTKISLYGSGQEDITKIKCLLVAHKWSYGNLQEIRDYGGRVYVRPNRLEYLLKYGYLRNMCAKSNIEFGVYTSLSTILTKETTPILCEGMLVLLHSSVMDMDLLGKLLRVLEFDQHSKILIPSFIFKKCIQLQCHDAQRIGHDKSIVNNLKLLLKCINSGVAHVISSEGPWENLGHSSSKLELLYCLKVIHRQFKFVHRHPVVLVDNHENYRDQQKFYRLCSVSVFFKDFIKHRLKNTM